MIHNCVVKYKWVSLAFLQAPYLLLQNKKVVNNITNDECST